VLGRAPDENTVAIAVAQHRDVENRQGEADTDSDSNDAGESAPSSVTN
jgi:hypothetical protein